MVKVATLGLFSASFMRQAPEIVFIGVPPQGSVVESLAFLMALGPSAGWCTDDRAV